MADKRFTTIKDAGFRAALIAFSPNVERGALSAFASRLGISVSAVSQWDQIPVHMVPAVERLTGVPRDVLRPDIYPKEKQRA